MSIINEQAIIDSVKTLTDAELHQEIDDYDQIIAHLHRMKAPEGLEAPWKTYVEREEMVQRALINEFSDRISRVRL